MFRTAVLQNILILTSVFATLALPATARAEEETKATGGCGSYVPSDDKSDPHVLALRGVDCFEAGDYLQALIFYRRAYDISKSVPLRAAIGRSLQELGYPDLAREYFVSYLQVQTDDTAGYQKIEQRLQVVEEDLASRASETTITSSPGGATVFIVLQDEYWEEVGKTPLRVRLLPGDYRLVIRREGFITREEQLAISEGGSASEMSADLVPQDSLFDTPNARWRRRGAYLMLGSIPFLVAGGTLFVLSTKRFDEANEYRSTDPNFDADRRADLNDEGYTLQTWSIVSSAVGGTALVTGLAFYLVGLEDDDVLPEGTSLIVGPSEIGFAWSF